MWFGTFFWRFEPRWENCLRLSHLLVGQFFRLEKRSPRAKTSQSFSFENTFQNSSYLTYFIFVIIDSEKRQNQKRKWLCNYLFSTLIFQHVVNLSKPRKSTVNQSNEIGVFLNCYMQMCGLLDQVAMSKHTLNWWLKEPWNLFNYVGSPVVVEVVKAM